MPSMAHMVMPDMTSFRPIRNRPSTPIRYRREQQEGFGYRYLGQVLTITDRESASYGRAARATRLPTVILGWRS